MKALIDNNIQIYRTTTTPWHLGACDDIFSTIEPVLTDYVLMEYRKTVIRSISFISQLVKDLPNQENSNDLKIRLGDLLQEVASPKHFYFSDRRRKLVIAILGYYLNERPEILSGVTASNFMENLEFWAEELEEHEFYSFNIGGVRKSIKNTKDFYKISLCPLAESQKNYNCSKGKNSCIIVDLIKSNSFLGIIEKILNGCISSYQGNLDILELLIENPGNDGKSIGQKICFKLSDIFHATFCYSESIGLLTADIELAELSRTSKIPTYVYSFKNKLFKKI